MSRLRSSPRGVFVGGHAGSLRLGACERLHGACVHAEFHDPGALAGF